jgi:DNA (cytosine-5)-methyltransferase 1
MVASAPSPTRTAAVVASPRLRSVELFAGGGGMALGLHEAGFDHSLLVEFDPKACDTLLHNAQTWENTTNSSMPWSKNSIVCQDVRALNLGSSEWQSLDLLAGGPPCQPFSLGGIHAGMDDQRNMFPAALQIVRHCMPKLVLFENVAGLLRKSFAPYFDYVIMQLRDPFCVAKADEPWQDHAARLASGRKAKDTVGYHVTRQLVNAADFGIPQQRKRIILMAVRTDLAESPLPEIAATHSEAALLYSQTVSGEYWQRHNIAPPPDGRYTRGETTNLQGELDIAESLPWQTIRDALNGLPTPIDGLNHPHFKNHMGVPGARAYPGHTGSEFDRPSKTIKAGVHGVCGGEAMIRFADGSLRYMTVRESARIQTFPDDYEFRGARSHAMRHIGNAVPVKLAQAIGLHMRFHTGI